MGKAKILIADDHSVVIQGIKSALKGNTEFEVVGESGNGIQAVENARSLHPDIVIMDISMPHLSGLEAAKQIITLHPDIRVIIYTMYSDKELVVDLFKAGISAYVLKDDPLSDLILALKAVKEGGTYFSTLAPTVLIRYINEIESIKPERDTFDCLSKREQEVFRLLAEGKSVKETAYTLLISPKTVESHKYNIMEKLHLKSIIDFTKIAIRKNLIHI